MCAQGRAVSARGPCGLWGSPGEGKVPRLREEGWFKSDFSPVSQCPILDSHQSAWSPAAALGGWASGWDCNPHLTREQAQRGAATLPPGRCSPGPGSGWEAQASAPAPAHRAAGWKPTIPRMPLREGQESEVRPEAGSDVRRRCRR